MSYIAHCIIALVMSTSLMLRGACTQHAHGSLSSSRRLSDGWIAMNMLRL